MKGWTCAADVKPPKGECYCTRWFPESYEHFLPRPPIAEALLVLITSNIKYPFSISDRSEEDERAQASEIRLPLILLDPASCPSPVSQSYGRRYAARPNFRNSIKDIVSDRH